MAVRQLRDRDPYDNDLRFQVRQAPPARYRDPCDDDPRPQARQVPPRAVVMDDDPPKAEQTRASLTPLRRPPLEFIPAPEENENNVDKKTLTWTSYGAIASSTSAFFAILSYCVSREELKVWLTKRANLLLQIV